MKLIDRISDIGTKEMNNRLPSNDFELIPLIFWFRISC